MERKLIAIVGPTAAGKSALGVKIAKKFGGEIISADSRQVYKGMDIGTGKITKREMMGIPHHLLDAASPRRQFTVSQFQKLAYKAIKKIFRKEKIPILVGGSPLYIYAVIDGWVIPEVKPNARLRRDLEKLSTDTLFQKLQRIDSKRAKTIEKQNRRRLIRALEIVMSTKQPVPPLEKKPLPCPVLFLGIQKNTEELRTLIARRLEKRFKQGMVREVKRLHAQGLSWKRLESFGLEYKCIAQYFQKKISKEKMKQQLQKVIEDFARRQMVWFKKDPRIRWIQTLREAQSLARDFLK
ncbi:MAG: tRNA (adenosine(37)-N6)-dimethylallyltransferase MiaA [Candidatus Wildermuthbacteria bacterium]|nr:tRNA (adenosine(37)-N6)-dimethylallyltransferase MiaA [Candidatus Wildermuthbacteria bacterium]